MHNSLSTHSNVVCNDKCKNDSVEQQDTRSNAEEHNKEAHQSPVLLNSLPESDEEPRKEVGRLRFHFSHFRVSTLSTLFISNFHCCRSPNSAGNVNPHKLCRLIKYFCLHFSLFNNHHYTIFLFRIGKVKEIR
jgi:hypothetical protein